MTLSEGSNNDKNTKLQVYSLKHRQLSSQNIAPWRQVVDKRDEQMHGINLAFYSNK